MDREKHVRDSTEMGMTVELIYITFSSRITLSTTPILA